MEDKPIDRKTTPYHQPQQATIRFEVLKLFWPCLRCLDTNQPLSYDHGFMDFHNLEQIGFPGLDATLRFIDLTIRKLQRHFLYITFATSRASIPQRPHPT